MSLSGTALGVIVIVAVVAALLVVVADVRHDERPIRRWPEALLPAIGLLALVALVIAGR